MPKNKPGARNLFLVSETYSELQSLLSQRTLRSFHKLRDLWYRRSRLRMLPQKLDVRRGIRLACKSLLFSFNQLAFLGDSCVSLRGLLVFEKNSHLAEFF
jgi:hypothetical protein